MEESWTQTLLTSSRRALGDFSARAELAVGGLESRLNHPNGGVRRAAVETLGRLASANLLKHVPKIVSLLDDDDDAVRTAAVDTLGKLGEGEGDAGQPSANGIRELTTLDKLLPALSLLNKMDAEELAQHKLQPDAFSDEILNAIKLLADPTNHAVRQPAMQIIGRLAPSALAHHAELLHWLLSDEAPQVRKAAIESIGRLPPSSALRYAEAMCARLEDVDNHVRLATLKMVGKLHGDRSMSHDMTSSVVARLADPDRYVRAAVRQQLGRLDAGALREVVPEIVPLLAHEAAEVRTCAWTCICTCPRWSLSWPTRQQMRLVAFEVMDGCVYACILNAYACMWMCRCTYACMHICAGASGGARGDGCARGADDCPPVRRAGHRQVRAPRQQPVCTYMSMSMYMRTCMRTYMHTCMYAYACMQVRAAGRQRVCSQPSDYDPRPQGCG